MTRKTRKTHHKDQTRHKRAKKATKLKCLLKTCRAKKYQAVYGASAGGSIRSHIALYN
jgi:hypothetical protein